MIFIDSSVLYNALVKTELTPLAERVFEEKEAKITSDIVVDEVWFVLMKREGGSVGKVRKLLQKDEEFRTKAVEYLAGILAFLNAYGIVVVRDSHNWAKTSTFLRRYGLLPHDARILATAIEYGCERLATLDDDFKVVKDLVEIVPGKP